MDPEFLEVLIFTLKFGFVLVLGLGISLLPIAIFWYYFIIRPLRKQNDCNVLTRLLMSRGGHMTAESISLRALRHSSPFITERDEAMSTFARLVENGYIELVPAVPRNAELVQKMDRVIELSDFSVRLTQKGVVRAKQLQLPVSA